MNIRAIIGSGVVIVGIGMGAVYWLSQPSPKCSLYQEDEFVSVTSMEEVKPEITVKTPEQIQPAEAIKQDTADQSNQAVEPVIVTDASSVEVKTASSSAVIEPVIVERDPTEATERGFTVTVYPHETQYNNTEPMGLFNTNKLMATDEHGRIPIGILAPEYAKYVAEGYIHIEEDGFYYIYPMENIKWTAQNIAQNKGSYIFSKNGNIRSPVAFSTLSYRGGVRSSRSQILVEISNNIIFDKIYSYGEYIPMTFQQVYLKKGIHPVRITFDRTSYNWHHQENIFITQDLEKGAFPGINIMQRKVSDSSDLGFLYKNRRQANIFTFRILESDNTIQANIENPRQIKYLNIANDIKTENPTNFSRRHTSYKDLDPVNNFIFDFIPEESGMYIFANKVYPHWMKSLHPKRKGNALTGRYYGCFVSFNVDNITISEIPWEYAKDAGFADMYEMGGKGYFVDVAQDQVGKRMQIEINYKCALTKNKDNNEYTFSTLLKTPGNNSFLPLEDFAVKEQ